MTTKIARTSFGIVSVFTVTLTLWKSSQVNHETYINMENYIGGSTTLHFTFSLLIGFFAILAFPSLSSPTKSDIFGIRLLLCLLLVISAEELSQLFITNRTFSIEDLSTNWIGMLLGYFAAKSLELVRKRK